MKIIWSDFSELQLDLIFEFYQLNFNLKTAKKVIEEILLAPNILQNNPELGQIEPLLTHRKIQYRYILVDHIKIIYSFDKEIDCIKITDVFDTRQNPEKINRSF